MYIHYVSCYTKNECITAYANSEDVDWDLLLDKLVSFFVLVMPHKGHRQAG